VLCIRPKHIHRLKHTLLSFTRTVVQYGLIVRVILAIYYLIMVPKIWRSFFNATTTSRITEGFLYDRYARSMGYFDTKNIRKPPIEPFHDKRPILNTSKGKKSISCYLFIRRKRIERINIINQ
jgi:hypothetical protein